MTRLIPLLGFGLAAACLPQFAAAQSATLNPGLYELSEKVVRTGGQVGKDAVTEACILAGDNNKTLEGLLLDFTKREDECTLSNVEHTASTMRSNFTCPPLSTGGDVGGTIEAEYGTDFFNHTLNAKFGPIVTVKITKELRRKGECPAG